MSSFSEWNHAMPVYVTRKSASGWTGSVSVPIWSAALAVALAVANVIAWGGIGLYEAVKFIAS